VVRKCVSVECGWRLGKCVSVCSPMAFCVLLSSLSLPYSPLPSADVHTPSTRLTLWSLSRNWVLILKELRSLPPSSMCTLWTWLLNLSIPDVPFSILLSTLIRSRFQAKPATLLIPIDFPFLFAVEELYGTRYQSGSFSLVYVGSGSHCLRSLSLSLRAFS